MDVDVVKVDVVVDVDVENDDVKVEVDVDVGAVDVDVNKEVDVAATVVEATSLQPTSPVTQSVDPGTREGQDLKRSHTP